ncbi:MAG: hypothetical protein U9N53_04790 [Bacteroidota bacterium]|nr:hypothetical protein [Bacteroidota bacterium]
MRKIHLVIIILYFIIACYFALFNWAIFSVSLDIDFGFSIIQIPLIAMVFSFSLIFLLIQLGITYLSDLGHERDLGRKESDIQSFKAELHDHKSVDLEVFSEKLNSVDQKLDELLQRDTKTDDPEHRDIVE